MRKSMNQKIENKIENSGHDFHLDVVDFFNLDTFLNKIGDSVNFRAEKVINE